MKKVFLSLFLFLTCIPVAAAIPEGVDSTLFVYYRLCNNIIREVSVLKTADTLFQLSVEKNDVRMQAAALSMKADHYYYTNNLDSLKAWLPRVERFGRENNQLKYYYFTWNRLILYYTKKAQYTLAQYELQRLLEQAQKDDHKLSVAQAYQQLGHIYVSKGLARTASDYYRKAIDYIEKNKVENYGLGTLYVQYAEVLINLEDYAGAEQALGKARENITQPAQEWTIKLRMSVLLVYQGRLGEANRLFREVEQHAIDIPRDRILEARYVFHLQNKSYRKALQTVDSMIAEYQRLGMDEIAYVARFKQKAKMHARLGDNRAAYDNLTRYVDLLNQKNAIEGEAVLGEFATLFDVTRLDRENAALQQETQAARLRRTKTVIISLASILLLAVIFIVIQIRMTRRLARAKRKAEESNRMKSIFIRNITHEINTPLNAIVGFAEHISKGQLDDDEHHSYTDIIRENSDSLQKIIDDVLYISDIESSDTAPARTQVNLDECCNKWINSAAASYPGNITLRFVPGEGNVTALISRRLVGKVISELLQNALRFTRQGSVTLTYTVSNGRVIFLVADTGPGIPAAEAGRIFDKFFKLDPFSQGMGLGLGVCMLIAQLLKGEIYLDTTYSPGARFVFSVPAE